MSMKLYNESHMVDIANAIRNKSGLGEESKFKVSEMAQTILDIPSGTINIATSIVLTSNKTSVVSGGSVTFSATFYGTYSDGEGEKPDLYGTIANATLYFYDSNNTSLGSCITNENGEANFTLENITYDVTVYCEFIGTAEYPYAKSNNINLSITEYLYAPQLNGSELITTIWGNYTPSIDNYELVSGCGYLTDGWDNSGLWELTFEYYVTGDNNGYLVIPKGTSQRDYNGIQQWYNSNCKCYQHGNTLDSFNGNFSLNTWINVKIVKNSENTLTVYYDDVEKITFSWEQLTSEYPIMCIGLDKNSSRNTAKIRNIKVIPI